MEIIQLCFRNIPPILALRTLEGCYGRVLARPGHKTTPPLQLPNLRHRTFSTREFDVSSTDVRELVRDRQPFEHLVPAPVASFIKKHNLYQ